MNLCETDPAVSSRRTKERTNNNSVTTHGVAKSWVVVVVVGGVAVETTGSDGAGARVGQDMMDMESGLLTSSSSFSRNETIMCP